MSSSSVLSTAFGPDFDDRLLLHNRSSAFGPQIQARTHLRDLVSPQSSKPYLGLYFSAHWCPPCRHFTPELSRWFTGGGSEGIDIVFISSDNDQTSFDEYFASMPWHALPYSEADNTALRDKYKVQGIPTLVVLSSETGELITDSARQDIVIKDPQATLSAWTPEGQRRKREVAAAAQELLRQELPIRVKRELELLGVNAEVRAVELAVLLRGAAVERHQFELLPAQATEAAENVLNRFGGRLNVQVVVETLLEELSWCSTMEEVQVWTDSDSGDMVADVIYRDILSKAVEGAIVDKEWGEQSGAAAKCTQIFQVFDNDQTGVLDKQQFEKLIERTMGRELEGLFEHMLNFEECKERNGIVPAQLYKFVYHIVFPGRREGSKDPKRLIEEDHKKLCIDAVSSKRANVLASHLRT